MRKILQHRTRKIQCSEGHPVKVAYDVDGEEIALWCEDCLWALVGKKKSRAYLRAWQQSRRL